MMKQRTSFLTRCLAFALALVLLVSNANLGVALNVFAAESDKTVVTAGELVANNYELTDAEKKLLSSGNLVGDTIAYTVPSDSALVTIDSDNKAVAAQPYENWVPVTAAIVVNGETKETVTLTDGKGNYAYDGNAFSVVVKYELTAEVSEDIQNVLLNAAADLKQGVANTDAVSEQSSNLAALETAMPQLVDAANNGIGGLEFKDEVVATVLALDDEMAANGGKLVLSSMIEAYNKGSKTEYLMTEGVAMQAELVELSGKVSVVRKMLDDTVQMAEMIIGWNLPNKAEIEAVLPTLKMMASIAGNLDNGLAVPAADTWTAANMGTNLVKADANYAALDVQVAELGNVSTAEVKNPLTVASTEITANLAMFNVNIEVILNTVKDEIESAELVEAGKVTEILTLGAGASKADIVAAIEASGIVDQATASWEAYVDGAYEATESALPETLEEDITYTVAYNPVDCTVKTNYAGDMTVPYGYQLKLPVSTNEAQSFDYSVNGTAYTEGSVVTIIDNTEIKRSTGKAYIGTDLYTIIAGNYSEGHAAEILTSGALLNNVAVSYRAPEIGDVQLELTLENKTVTAKPYASSYAGLNWNAYSYDGNLFEGATSAEWLKSSVTVVYRLDLTNTSVEEVKAILALPETLKKEAADQNAALLRLKGDGDANYNNMASLTEFNVGLLMSAINGVQLNANSAKNTAMQQQFTAIFKNMKDNCFDKNDADGTVNLTIYNLLTGYTNNGLVYYYQNSEAFIDELAMLSGYMTALLAEDAENGITKEDKIAGLQKVAAAAGYGEYAEKIVKLEQVMSEVHRDLKAPNANIDLSSKKLVSLVALLEAEAEVKVSENPGHAYIVSDELPVVSDDMIVSSVIMQLVDENGVITFKRTISTDAVEMGGSFDMKAVNDKMELVFDEMFNNKVDGAFLNIEIVGSFDALNGPQYDSKTVTITYSYKTFDIEIDGEATQTISKVDETFILPKHPTAGWEYRYTVNGEYVGTVDTYTMKKADWVLVVNGGKMEISRVAVNLADEKFEQEADKLDDSWEIIEDENGNVTGLIAKKPTNGVVSIAMDLVGMGYDYVGLGGKDLMFTTEGGDVKISLQTLIDAMLNYEKFSNKMIIDLAKNNGGTVIESKMVLGTGNAAKEVDFTLILTDAPAKLQEAAGYMEKVEGYLDFESNNGELLVNMTLPEKVYEVYLTALLGTCDVDVKDINAVDTEVAIRVFYDYFDYVLNSDATTTTYTNTLNMLGINRDLTKYEGYYQKAKSLLQSERVEINSVKDDGIFDIYLAVLGNGDIDKLLSLAGLEVPDMYKNMVLEYSEEGKVEVTTTFELTNTAADFDAFIIDPKQGGFDKDEIKDDIKDVVSSHDKDAAIDVINTFKNKVDYTKDFASASANIAGPAAIVLMNDVTGDITFNHTTVIDLNGYTINGNVTANATVLVMDSSLDSTVCGGITGNVTGDLIITSGNYNVDVTEMLPDGYKQDGTAVRNALYNVKADAEGNLTFIVNTDVMHDESVNGYLPSAKALACEVALDLVMNFYQAAGLKAEGQEIYGFNFADLVGVIGSDTTKSDAVNMILGCVNAPGISNLVNTILADLLDFGAIESAINNGTPVATYTFNNAALALNVEHITDGDYMALGVKPDYSKGKNFSVSLVFEGENKAKLAKAAGALDEIVVEATATVDVKQPYYANRTLWLDGSANAYANVDLTVNDKYLTIMTIIMANGNPEHKDALISALNADNMEDLKDEFDKLSVRDVCDALKAVTRNDNFTTLAEKTGANFSFGEVDMWEKAFSLFMAGAGKVLEKLEITGPEKIVGNLDKDDDGVYEWGRAGEKNPDITRRGFTVDAIVAGDAELIVKIFPSEETDDPDDPDDPVDPVECMWGDADHDNDVDTHDASLVLQYWAETIDPDQEFCTERTDVDCDGDIDTHDASLILQYWAGTIEELPVVAESEN